MTRVRREFTTLPLFVLVEDFRRGGRLPLSLGLSFERVGLGIELGRQLKHPRPVFIEQQPLSQSPRPCRCLSLG